MCNTVIRVLSCLLLSLALAAGAAAQDFQEGTDYKRLGNPQPPITENGKVEVVEAFSYHCPHCYRFEPVIQDWAEQQPETVELIHLPVVFRADWEPGARAYYIAETLGILEQTHEAFFSALHDERRRMRSEDDLAAFFADFGVDRETFDETNGSFELDTKLRRAQDLARRYRVMGVPMVIVNGKYEVTGSMAGSLERMLEILDYLIARELAATG